VVLLPGSRSAAVGRIFPLLLSGYKKARQSKPELKATVVYPSENILQQLQSILQTDPELAESIDFVSNIETGVAASAVLMSSGTMSLACALSGIPGAIAYRLNPLSYWLGKMLVSVKYIGIANLLLDRPLHPEYIQGAASASNLSEELARALEDPSAADDAMSSAEQLRELLHAGSDATAAKWLSRGL